MRRRNPFQTLTPVRNCRHNEHRRKPGEIASAQLAFTSTLVLSCASQWRTEGSTSEWRTSELKTPSRRKRLCEKRGKAPFYYKYSCGEAISFIRWHKFGTTGTMKIAGNRVRLRLHNENSDHRLFFYVLRNDVHKGVPRNDVHKECLVRTFWTKSMFREKWVRSRATN